ncbi:hypothetical protein DEO72_LG5g2552 [Vigna unguiculata]|uniref:Peptidase A2 domain-containing protein n=1 Tax=Vigna unguiculata TaxID=3917 RepID=A0A4D6M1J4_VIGUN|nr:hypothetical protein DEO72_LG5g2552 [Vigna unguiculata]
MEGKSSDSLGKHQCLETRLIEMLQNVEPPEMYDPTMQCIYRVPKGIRENNPKAYTPLAVSIGPFHKTRDIGKEDDIFESTEELKIRYFKGFLNRTQLSVREFVITLKTLEEKIRSCYAAPIKYNSDDFLQMILVDAFFIIELFLRCHRHSDWERKDPLLLQPGMLVEIEHDLILLENQLPFFVLEQLYNLTGMDKQFPSFLEICFNYFRIFTFASVCPITRPKHFTDLLRSSLISSSKLDVRTPNECKEVRHVYSASQLSEAGIKFKVDPNKGLLDLSYADDGMFTMPILNINDDTEMMFRNIMAFEQCHLPHTNIINQYLQILDFLIDTEKDVNVLVNKKIIVNWMGDATAVATMINGLGSNLTMPDFNSHYFSICNSLNEFYENPRNKYKAIFIHEYFNTPWKIASTIAATVLLFLTFVQTIDKELGR